MGHDIEALRNGETISSTVTVNSLEEFKLLFANELPQEYRDEFAKMATSTAAANYQSAAIASVANLTQHVYGNHLLSSEDLNFATQIFPLKVQATSAADLTINSDEQFGPNATPQAINAGTLKFSGGSLTAITTALSISADTLLVQSGGSKPYIIGIVGLAGVVGISGVDGAIYASAAANGTDANIPTPGICTGASDGGDATNGAKGNVGNPPVSPGQDGQSNLPATIAIKAVDPSSAPLVIFSQGGVGGAGGTGGQGGQGQTGGNGGNGCDTGCEGTNGGNGGNGGDGGDGGVGGNGGNGVSGPPISVIFPSASQSLLTLVPTAAPPGAAGSGGGGGAAGVAGACGSGGKNKHNGNDGGGGSAGSAGKNGSPGANTGAGPNILPTYI